MIDIGVIGIGNMGLQHARILSQMKNVNAVYVYDKNKTALQEVASEFDCMTSSSKDAFLECVNAVTIATPTPSHFKIAKDALEHGLHTFVEKPLCSTIDDAMQLCLLEETYTDLVTGVGHIERFNPVISFIKKALKEPSFIRFTRHNPGSDRITDTHVVDDLMIHDIDLINYLIDMKRDQLVVASVGDENTFASVIDNGYPIILSASRLATKKTREIYIEDKDYTIVADMVDQTVNIYHKPDTYTLVTQASYVGRVNLQRIEPLQHELATFVKCVEEKAKFPIPFQNGYANMMFAAALKRSTTEKEPAEEMSYA